MLESQRPRRVDVTAPAVKMRAENGMLVIEGTEPVLSEDGVTEGNGLYRPTEVFNEGVAQKLGIPAGYLKRLHADRPDLYDRNVNGWLHGRAGEYPADDRTFLVRTFKADDSGHGIARALLSDRYGIMDNLDVLMASLEGMYDVTGGEAPEFEADLTDRRMVVRVHLPEIQALAPTLLGGYRSPFTGQSGDDLPVLFAGVQISNSEVGGGASTITPRLVVQVCTNGMTVTKDALRSVHLGGKLEEGVIQWSAETEQRALGLVKAKAADAVRTFINVDYMADVIKGWERRAGEELETVEAVREVTKPLLFTQDQTEAVLAMFVKGGQMTLGGVVNAVTAYARETEDGDEAYDMEARALKLLDA